MNVTELLYSFSIIKAVLSLEDSRNRKWKENPLTERDLLCKDYTQEITVCQSRIIWLSFSRFYPSIEIDAMINNNQLFFNAYLLHTRLMFPTFENEPI